MLIKGRKSQHSVSQQKLSTSSVASRILIGLRATQDLHEKVNSRYVVRDLYQSFSGYGTTELCGFETKSRENPCHGYHLQSRRQVLDSEWALPPNENVGCVKQSRCPGRNSYFT